MVKAKDSTNPWIRHVAEMAEKLHISYACASSDPRVTSSYEQKVRANPPPPKPRAPRKPRASRAKPSTAPFPPAPYGAKQPSSGSLASAVMRSDAANRARVIGLSQHGTPSQKQLAQAYLGMKK